MDIQIEHFELPSNWAVALMYGDESIFEGDEEEFKAYGAFVDDMVSRYGKCWCLDVGDEEFFTYYHEASGYGVGGANCLTYAFDVSNGA